MISNQDLVLVLVYLLTQAAVPLLTLWIVYLVGRWIYCSFIAICHPDGGHRWREQQRRHAREKAIFRLGVFCLLAGIGLSVSGFGEGTMVIRVYGLELENAGIGVLLVAVMCFIVHALLRLPEASENDEMPPGATVPRGAVASPAAPKRVGSMPKGTSAPAVAFPNLNYATAAVITAILLPFIHVFAIAIGGVLAWIVWQRQRL